MATKDLQMYVPLFDGTNYQAWKDGLDAFTKAMKCYPPIENDPPVVGANNATQATVDKFNEMDQQVQGIIQLRIGASYKSHLKATAKLTIAELKTVFGTPGRIGALVELRSLFQHRIKPGANPVHEANNLIECSNRLALAGFQLDERLVTMAILMALPGDWEQLVAYICSTTEDANFTLAKITAQIQREYQRRQAGKGKSTVPLKRPQNYAQRTTVFESSDSPTLLSRLTNVKPAHKPSFNPPTSGGGNSNRAKFPRCSFQGCHRNHFPGEFCVVGRQKVFYDQRGAQVCCAPVTMSTPQQGQQGQSAQRGRGSFRGNRGGGKKNQGGRGKGKGKKKAGAHVCFDPTLQEYDAPVFEEYQAVFIPAEEAPAGYLEEVSYDQETGASSSQVTVEMLDQEMDEYNTSRPYQPFTEDDHTALWGDEAMNPSLVDDRVFSVEAPFCTYWPSSIPTDIPLIDTMLPPPSTSAIQSESHDSRVRIGTEGWFVRRVHPLDALCRDSILYSEVDVDPMLTRRDPSPVYWDREGRLHLNERSHQGFFAGPVEDWMDQHLQFRVPLYLIQGFTRVGGIPAEVHKYSHEVICNRCNRTHPRYRFSPGESDQQEFIDLAIHMARVNTRPPVDLQPPSIDREHVMVHQEKNTECLLCHSPSSSLLCLTCEKRKKADSVFILLDSGSSKHCTNDIRDYLSYHPYSQPRESLTADKDTTVKKLGSGTVLMYHNDHVVHLTDVEYCPQLSCRLISTGQLTSKGYSLSTTTAGTSIFAPNGSLYLRSNPIASRGPLHYVSVLLQCIDERIQVLSSTKDEYSLWHQRMGHPSRNAVKHLHTATHDLRKISLPTSFPVCRGCAQGKMTERVFSPSYARGTRPLELVHSDLCDFPVSSYYNRRYVVTFIDDFSSFAAIYPVAIKSDTFRVFQEFRVWAESLLSCRLLRLRSDRGGEFRTNDFAAFVRREGIEQQFSSPDTPQQNGRAERFNRTMVEKAEVMRHAACLPPNLWQFALETSVHIYNRQPFRRAQWKTPIELWSNGKKPSVSYFRVFGCLAYVFIKKDQRSKLMPKSVPMIFLGYEAGSKAYRFLDDSGRIIISSNAIFDELVFPRCVKRSDTPCQNESYREENHDTEDNHHEYPMEVAPPSSVHDSHIPYRPNTDPNSNQESGTTESIHIPSELPTRESGIPKSVLRTQSPSRASTPVETRRFQPYPAPSSLRRSGRERVVPHRPDNVYGDVHPVEAEKKASSEIKNDGAKALDEESFGERIPVDFHRLSSEFGSDFLNYLLAQGIEPVSQKVPVQYRDVARLPADERKAWESACQDEIDALWKRKVWELTNLPSGRKPVRCRWVFAVKSDGRKRAHLVAKGFSQEYGVDYEDVFSPVARFESVRVILALAAQYSWELQALDVKTAFLYGNLEEEIYMEQPEGFVKKGKDERKVFRLRKALYGLKQAALAWNIELHKSLERLGFNRVKSNAGIYIHQGSTGNDRKKQKVILILIIYVDDVLFSGSN